MAMGLISTSLFVAWSVFSIGSSKALTIPRYDSSQNERGNGGNAEGGNKALQDILKKAHQGPLYDYPTSFTQEIMPVRNRRFLLISYSYFHGYERNETND